MEMKDTKIGFCIPDFDPIRLKDFLSSNDAGKWGSDPNGENDIAVVRSTNFNDTGYLDLSDVALRSLTEDEYKKTQLIENDIVIERSGGSATQPVGRVSFVTKEIENTGFGFSNFIQRIRVSDEYNAKYIFYCLYHLHSAGITQTMQTQTNGIRNLEYRYYLNQKLPKPSPNEQTQIANFLSTVDKTIQATKNSIGKLEKLKTSLMQNLLTGKMKPDGSWRTEDEFWIDDKFGKVPNGWVVSNIGSFGELKTGKTPPTADEKNFSITKDIPFVTPGDVDNSVYILDTERYVTKQGLKFSNSIPKDSVCFISIGSTIGKIAITTELCCSNQQINSIIPDKDNYFLFVYYQTMYNSPRIKSIAGVTATPQINKSDLSKFKLIKPKSFDEQKLIGDKLITIDDCIVKKQETISRFDSLKKSLMQNLLTGKVRLPQETLKQ
jgi:type I restriction enzyme S subunit